MWIEEQIGPGQKSNKKALETGKFPKKIHKISAKSHDPYRSQITLTLTASMPWCQPVSEARAPFEGKSRSFARWPLLSAQKQILRLAKSTNFPPTIALPATNAVSNFYLRLDSKSLQPYAASYASTRISKRTLHIMISSLRWSGTP